MYKKLLVSTICFSFLAGIWVNPGISFSEEIPENINLQTQKTEFSEDSLGDLKSKRDILLEENLSLYDIDTERRDNLRNYTLNDENGLIKYIDNKFSDVSEIEKLEKQNSVLNYLNKNKTIIDSEPLFIECVFKETELSNFLVNEKNDGNLTQKDNLIELAKKEESVFENSNFKNKEELTSYISALINANLTEQERQDLVINNIISSDIKQDLIKNLNESKKLNLSKLMLRTTPSQYRYRALAYATKHGYTNGYYGKGTWYEYYTEDNAPSPYINYNSYPGAYDCANFVSQCVHEGGAQFWTGGNPWYFYSDSNRSPSWTGANQFKDHWCARISYGDTRVNNTLSFLREATPISLVTSGGIAYHTIISTTRHSNGYNFSYAAHTDTGKRTNLLQKLKGIRIYYYKVYW